MYELEFSSLSLIGIAKLRKSDSSCYKKLEKLLEELKAHPQTGTGHPEVLKGTSVPTLWTRSYFCESVGCISEDTIKQYIENQRKI